MGCCASKPNALPSDAIPSVGGYPPEMVQSIHQVSTHSSAPYSGLPIVTSEVDIERPAYNTAQHGETPLYNPDAVLPKRMRSQTSLRHGDHSGHPSSPPGGVVIDMHHTHRPEMDSTQHPPRIRVPSKLEKSPSMDLLGARSLPSTGPSTRTESTSLLPNNYPLAGPLHPPTGPRRPPPGPPFQVQPVPRTGHVQANRQETRPQFPPNLQSLLSNDFRVRILVAGRRGSGKSSLINAVFNVDMSGAPKNAPGRTAEFRPRDNRHLIVHECSGSGPGELQAIRDFVTMYSHKNRPASERLHAIWICVPVSDVINGQFDESVTMLLGSRVPVVLVFTMFDVIISNIVHRNDYDNALAAASAKCEEFRRSLLGSVRAEIVSTQPTFRNFIEQLVKTVDDVIITSLRNVSVSPERQRSQSRIFPVALAWSVSQRANRNIKIQAAIEHVTSFLLVNLFPHIVRQSWAKQLFDHIGYWDGLASSDDFVGRTLASCVEVIHADIVGVWNLPDKDRYLSSSAFKAEIYHLVQDLSTSARSPPNGTPGTAAWLSNRYENSTENICLVVGYIVDLTLILCGVFGSPGAVSPNKVQSVKHKFASSGLKADIHAEICRFIETVPKFKYYENDVVVGKIADLVAQNCDII